MQIKPQWVTGFVDGEGTFYVGFNRNQEMKTGVQVLPEFRIVQHERDIKLLHALKKFFGAGVVRVNHDDRLELRIRKLEHLNKIVLPFFDQHPLLTQKRFDYLKFRKIVERMIQGRHLTKSGIIELIDIASKMNRGNKEKALGLRQELLRSIG